MQRFIVNREALRKRYEKRQTEIMINGGARMQATAANIPCRKIISTIHRPRMQRYWPGDTNL